MKILIPVDGSDNANRVVDFAIASAAAFKNGLDIALINVQWKLASGNVKLFIDQDTINEYYREQGMAALTEARSKLDAAGLAYDYHITVGSPAEAIVQYAQEKQIDQIYMGAQGKDKLSSMLLGSVTTRVVNLAKVPVLIVK